jgi:hypothetical protein
VFLNEETTAYNIILLNSIKKRMEFPALKAMALEEYGEWEMTTTAEAVLDFTDEEIQQMLDNLDSFTVERARRDRENSRRARHTTGKRGLYQRLDCVL